MCPSWRRSLRPRSSWPSSPATTTATRGAIAGTHVPGVPVPGSGISLCFGQHSGYGGYGNWVRGARQVRVAIDRLRAGCREADTWIRLETGAVVGSVTLNATYGRDWYPATPDDKTYCPTCNYTKGG